MTLRNQDYAADQVAVSAGSRNPPHIRFLHADLCHHGQRVFWPQSSMVSGQPVVCEERRVREARCWLAGGCPVGASQVPGLPAPRANLFCTRCESHPWAVFLRMTGTFAAMRAVVRRSDVAEGS